MTSATLYSIPQEPGRWRALAMATAVHVALFTLLWIGIRWQSETPVTLEAEVWSPQSQEAAPVPEPIKEIKPEPIPVEKPAAVVTEAKPDIALEQKKKYQAKKEKEQRIADEKAAAALAKKNKAIEKTDKAASEKKRLQEAAEEKLIAKTRDENMRRMMSNAGSGGSGDTAKSQGSRVDSSYVDILKAKIRSHTRFIVPPDLYENPSVEYTVELFPDGTVRSIKKEHSSHLPGFDEAVERAIRASSPFPADKAGNVPQSFNFPYTPKEK